MGFPDHDAVDYAAKQATLFLKCLTNPAYQLLTIKTIIALLSSKNGALAEKSSSITNFSVLRKHPFPGNPPLGGQEQKRSFSLN